MPKPGFCSFQKYKAFHPKMGFTQVMLNDNFFSQPNLEAGRDYVPKN